MAERKIGRRDFLKGMAATGLAVAGAAALAGCGKGPSAEAVRWNEEADVVVVGSGFAGLAAAIEAKNAGATVKVIEKMPAPGGNSIINGGDFAAPGTKMQEEQGIKDSPELMVQDMLKAGLYLNHVEKARIVAEQARDALEWTIEYLGARFARLTYHGGHSVPRTHQTINASGSEVVKKMLAKLKELGVTVETDRKLVRFIQNKEGRIVGIEVRHGYKFGDENSGAPVFIKARKAVVLASGGFSRDIKMRTIHDPRLTEEFESTNQPGATGEALREALKIGAMDVHLDWIQLGPWASPDEKGFGYVPLFSERVIGHGPIINPKTGKRFVNETGNRKERADAIILVGVPVIHVADSYAVQKQVVPETLEAGLKNGAIKQFNTLEEVAKHYNIPLEPFLKEIARWNSFVEKGKDEDFNCMIGKGARPMGAPPFYAVRLWPKVHHCMGGLVINTNAQVINQDFKPIKGLYAAGEVTGGTHGAVRLGGVAMADCIVFGRIAGKAAAKEEAWS
ncbi:MAG: flavocytochrome c [Firmicutes bacterium]|nr:flavocytochrome c [Bacillota bacterium]